MRVTFSKVRDVMKVKLPSGREVLVSVKYDEVTVKRKKKEVKCRTTCVKVTKIDAAGQAEWQMDGLAVCSEKDQFVKWQGRKFALVDMFNKDWHDAEVRASKKVASLPGRSKAIEVRDFLMFPRIDRTALFELLCSKLSQHMTKAQRKEKREKIERDLFEKLSKKFSDNLPDNLPKTIKVKSTTLKEQVLAGVG
jgi:hypothetical protein